MAPTAQDTYSIRETSDKKAKLVFAGSKKFGSRYAEVSVEGTHYDQIRNPQPGPAFLFLTRCPVLYKGVRDLLNSVGLENIYFK